MDHDFVSDNTESQRGVRNRVITYRNQRGWLHNTQGPALVFPSGRIIWAINGVPYTFDKWCDHLDIDEKTRTFLRLKYAV